VLLVPSTLLYLVAALLVLVTVVMRNVGYKVYEDEYTTRITTAVRVLIILTMIFAPVKLILMLNSFLQVLGLINTALYLVSTILAFKTYRGG
jgi:uncharacterized membrane protein